MKRYLPKNLSRLADECPEPLYLVGGSVRDFLLGYLPDPKTDWDLCSPMSDEALLSAAKRCGFRETAVYPRTGTVKLRDGENVAYEFTRFRSDKYVRGLHAPSEIVFTRELSLDAVRRDFCANAVYYDIKREEFVDPLGGIGDIERKILRTVAPADKVFGEDGLRLMRLARIAAQTGFSPDGECLAGAERHASLIRDIAPERIFAELVLLLTADGAHGDRDAPYRGLKLLDRIGVLDEILPELTLGRGMEQRAQFHDHDVLEHSLRCVRYSASEIRFAALLHDVGKPFCRVRDGNFFAHPEEGARIASKIMERWRAPKRLNEETAALVRLHMRDYNMEMKEGKIRREIVQNYSLLPKLFLLKQADYSACKDDLSPAPGVVKWQNVLQKMKQEGVPFTLRELKVDGDDLLRAGVPAREVGTLLSSLLIECSEDGSRNDRTYLLKRISKGANHD